jgi:WD40 repeat protein
MLLYTALQHARCSSAAAAAAVAVTAPVTDICSYTMHAGCHCAHCMQVDTDLYDLAKAGTAPCSLALSGDGSSMAVLSKDKRVRVFDFKRGKLRRAFDESLKVC